MKQMLYVILATIVGFVLGTVVGADTAKGVGGSGDNLVNGKCLYLLTKEFEVDRGNMPKSMIELEAWCRRDPMREAVLAKVKYVLYNDSNRLRLWSIRSKAGVDDPYIESGPLDGKTSQRQSLVIDRSGKVRFIDVSINAGW